MTWWLWTLVGGLALVLIWALRPIAWFRYWATVHWPTPTYGVSTSDHQTLLKKTP